MGDVEKTIIIILYRAQILSLCPSSNIGGESRYLAMVLVGGKVNMVDPDVGCKLDTDCVDGSQTFLDLEVPDDDVLLPQDSQANTDQSYNQEISRLAIRNLESYNHLLAPPLPRIDLLDPTATASLPLMVPVTITILATSSATADLRAASEETVVVAAPLPPLVLCY